MRHRRLAVAAPLLACALMLSGCEGMGMDPTGWFDSKKPLPGDRKEVFPGGVPGVPQGVPQDLVRGYEPPPEPPPPVVAEEKSKPKPKPKPKPKQAAAPARTTAAPQQAAPVQAWPSPQQSAPQQAQSPFPPPPQR
jgi:hypothetical protein